MDLVRERGNVPRDAVDAFFESGYHRADLLEIVEFVAVKTITNYVSQLSSVPLDEELEAFIWSPSDRS